MYPKHRIDPEDLLTFIELRGFTDDWTDLGLDFEEDLQALQYTIMLDPKASPVIAGTDGLRKLRFVPPGWRVGKSGALRVCYVHFDQFGVVLLVVAYRKSEFDDLSASGKKSINQSIARARQLLSNQFFK